MEPHHYCTSFDRNYAVRALALHRSLKRHAPAFVLWALCYDDESFELLDRLRLEHVRPLRLAELEAAYPALETAKANRSRVEYYFTCTPALPLYVLDHDSNARDVAYVDADLFFYSSAEAVFDELADGDVLVVEHRFPPDQRHRLAHGVFNVGLVAFRRSRDGLACLRHWHEQCLEWCYDRLEGDRYADQKYLDEWPHRYSGTRVSQHPGVGLAPWNVSNSRLERRSGQVLVDGKPLVFYHFQGLRRIAPYVYEHGAAAYAQRLTAVARRHIYGPYLRELSSVAHTVKDVRPLLPMLGSARYGTPTPWLLLRLLGQQRLLFAADGVVV